MKRAIISGERRTAVVDAPEPGPVDDWVKVKVHAAPMCTEHKGFTEGHENEFLGHEAAGEVVDVADSAQFDVGDRVVAMPLYSTRDSPLSRRGDYIYADKIDVSEKLGSEEGSATYAQYLLKPDWLLAEIPAGVSYEHGSMACCGLGPTLGALDRMDTNGFHTVLVNGLGPVGLGGVINAMYRGARVIAVEPTDYRTELALELGADEVIDPIEEDVVDRVMELTDGVGVDRAIDCTGIEQAQRAMIDSVRTRGEAAFIADAGEVDLDVASDMIYRGLTLHGSWHYNESLVPDMMRMIPNVSDQIDVLVTHEFSLDDVQEAFELQETRECGKVLLKPWE
ncbi:zinc-binding dehydrogenase [Haladaptatus sp. CMAA 1911]|uniref:zinc-dependent alcohol dehydrogenase n=1 Tax=unclassified Haladaptatus TaxID=2622732 RepID=UPI0037541106